MTLLLCMAVLCVLCHVVCHAGVWSDTSVDWTYFMLYHGRLLQDVNQLVASDLSSGLYFCWTLCDDDVDSSERWIFTK